MDHPKPSEHASPHDDDQSHVPSSPTDERPRASLLYRPGYQRVSSNAAVDTEYHSPPSSRAGDRAGEGSSDGHGLGITNLKASPQGSISRVPIGTKTPSRKASSTNLLQSPTSTQVDDTHDNGFQDVLGQHTNASVGSSLHQPYGSIPDTERLTAKTPDFTERPFGPRGSGTNLHCRSRRNIHQGRRHWLSITVVVLAVYSTVFSAIWLVVAAVRPRYGQTISTVSGGRLSPGNASLITTALAKSIELSFVTVFVAFLGQVLSRRALALQSKGISIAEMSLRTLVMQPGTMITHWENVRYAGTSFLGVVALTAAVLAMLYTTASDALVSPKLRFGKTEPQMIAGRVATQFANPDYIKSACRTPISSQMDPDNAGNTCIAIEHAGQAYHNYAQYLGAWDATISAGNGSKDLKYRPPPMAMLFDNTTVNGSWIHIEDMTTTSNRYGRIINNVTLAMPHAGIFAAARDPINNILQPQDLNGLGEFKIEASIPSFAINVLCVEMTVKELNPLVYTSWPRAAKHPLDVSSWPNGHGVPVYPDWPNATVVDDIFEFGEKYGRRSPIFAKLPIPYNTLLNFTNNYVDAIYILAASPKSKYMLCSLSASLTPNCSTTYHSSMTGGQMTSNCDDPDNSLAYGKSCPNASNGLRNYDFTNVAFTWATAISLGDGITDGNSSNGRLLTQLIPTSRTLEESLPSIAEALAVLSGCTLLISSLDAPFIHYWNYSTTVPILKSPQYQRFNATLAFQDYASYGNQPWQNVFFLVLVLVFVMNLLCLVFFFMRGGLVTDFVEPQNLFALSLNSPSSQYLDGSCGGGPEGEQLRARWWINMENEHFWIGNREGESIPLPSSTPLSGLEYYDSPISKSYSRLSAHKTSIL